MCVIIWIAKAKGVGDLFVLYMKYKVPYLHRQHHMEPPAALTLIWLSDCFVSHVCFAPCLFFCFFVCVFWSHVVINQRPLLLQCWEKALMMGEHPWLVVLKRQRSRFTLLIQSILCWRGVAKQPQGTEWDSNSGDLELQRAYHWSLFLWCEVSLLTLHTIF